MSVILIYVAFVLIGDTIVVGIASLVEHFSESISLLVFFALFITVFWGAWKLAVHVAERYIVGET